MQDMSNLDLGELILQSKKMQSRNILSAFFNILVTELGSLWSNSFSLIELNCLKPFHLSPHRHTSSKTDSFLFLFLLGPAKDPQLQIHTPNDQLIFISVNQSTGFLEIKPSILSLENRSVYANTIIQQIQRNPLQTPKIILQLLKSVCINSLS